MTLTLLAFVVALGALVIVHELGHFWVAKRLGVKVLRFSVGFGPIVARRNWGETEYALSAVPLGGYVKMLGEGDDAGVAAEPTRSFEAQPLGRRMAIVLAGPVMNLLFAFVVYAALLATVGMDAPSTLPLVGQITPDSPAARAGLMPGDRVLAIDGRSITSWDQLAATVRASGGKPLAMRLERDGAERTVEVVPELKETKTLFGESSGSTYLIGVGIATERKHFGPVEAVWRGAQQTVSVSYIVLKGFVLMLTGRVSARELGGPIAIAQTAGEQARAGLEQYLTMLAFLSINLGVLNLLPIPLLDGGQLTLFGIEAVLRRPLRPRVREAAQNVGLLVLVGLMVFVLFNDISRLVQG
ncbi:MAG TPA: RIP metalloprotease RseP [Candidatus Limnocylindria bacterium]|nr:RIP metalloprotease RseP [Candidatus Limnocylindria bacterium]